MDKDFITRSFESAASYSEPNVSLFLNLCTRGQWIPEGFFDKLSKEQIDVANPYLWCHFDGKNFQSEVHEPNGINFFDHDVLNELIKPKNYERSVNPLTIFSIIDHVNGAFTTERKSKGLLAVMIAKVSILTSLRNFYVNTINLWF